MSQSEKLDDCKKEIRSILLPYQKGCYLGEFNRAYRELIGRRLPSRDFGFSDEVKLLYSMPDVVKITPTRSGEYHLQAVADENTKHIQKMVGRQKPAKGKVISRSFKPTSRSYIIPPRFTENISRHIDPTRGFKRYPEPREAYKAPIKPVQKEPLLQLPPKLPPKASPKDEVIALVQHFGNKLALKDVLLEYNRMYDKDLLLSKYGYSSLEDCLEDIPELFMKNIDRCVYVVYGSEPSDDIFTENYDSRHTSQLSTSHKTVHETNELQSFNAYAEHKSQNDGGAFIPNPFKNKLKMVAEKYKEMRSSEFPSCFEKVTGSVLDLYSLGYRCLNDLIDDVPDIFTRTPIAGSRSDYIISVASEYKNSTNASNISYYSSSLSGAPLVHQVVLNIRNILEAYPEGIEFQEFSNTYGINCQEVLHVQDFGFEDLETFLRSIKNQVPLTIDSSEGVKVIRMVDRSSDDFVDETIPVDAAHPNFKFSPQLFPSDFDLSMYIPVYTSSVANPGHLYIQLQGEDTADELTKISDQIETFYNGSKSELYKMKRIHIKVGASCIAKWPSDNHWYRAEITSIPSLETVSVFYVDYGTRDTISTNLLRYIKKEFVDLPAQAIKCRLAFLKPAGNAAKWSIESRSRILNMCEDTSLMAKVEEVGATDGVYSIVLCDTNGEEDVYINDVLRNEGFAEYDDVVGDAAIDNSAASKPPVPMPVEYHNLNALQALQAKYFLQAFVTVAPSFAQNENYINLLHQVNMCFSNPDTGNQTAYSLPRTTTSGPPGFHTLQPDPYAYSAASALCSTQRIPSPVVGVSQDIKQKLVISSAPANVVDAYIPAPKESELITSPKTLAYSPDENYGTESEIFDDDDDEIFQQFCQQRLHSSKLRHVKKVPLGDGYKIHVIVVESVPYASSGDVSHLIWNNKESDYLSRRLQLKEVDIPTLKLSEDGHEELFQQLERYSVKGVQKTTGCKASISLFPLKVVIKILNIFGHPSVTLRTKLTEEIANFDADDPCWMTVPSPESPESDEENFSGATDDDKIEKLCLSDLLTMKESIVIRRKKMLHTVARPGNKANSDEMEKLEQLHQKVLQRIQEIKEICNVFA